MFWVLVVMNIIIYDKQAAGSSKCNSKSSFAESSNNELLPLVELIRNKHILLLHAGGDSKRVPWANPMGKVFLPLPYMAADDPDGPVPLLFDHILAIASCARQAFQNEGYLFCPVRCSKCCQESKIDSLYVMLSPISYICIMFRVLVHIIVLVSKFKLINGTLKLQVVCLL